MEDPLEEGMVFMIESCEETSILGWNEKTEREIKETIPFTIARKRIKYLEYIYLKKQKTYT